MNSPFCDLILTENVTVNIVPVTKMYLTARANSLQIINDTWKTANATADVEYTNSNIFNIADLKWSFEGGFVLEGFFVQYKDFFCQRKYGDIGLGIKPLGVSGIVNTYSSSSQNLILFGKRAKHLTQYPEYFEMVPSGGVDDKCLDLDGNLSLNESIILEFEEELNVKRSFIKNIIIAGVLIDLKDQVYDILIKLITDFDQIDFKPTNEYTEFKYIPSDSLSDFIEKNKVVPTSIAVSMVNYLYK